MTDQYDASDSTSDLTREARVPLPDDGAGVPAQPEIPEEAQGGAASETADGRQKGIAGRVKHSLLQVAKATYDARADDLQERAISAMREALAQESERLVEYAKLSYDDRADDLEERAVRAIRKVFDEEADRLISMATDTYDSRADDLEERAARALRAALIHESRRIQALIEHSVTVKRREVRLSLLVLVVANLIYLVVYWLTGQ